MTYYRVVPTKPDRPLTSIVFPKSGSSYFRKVGLPETKDELERAIVERFVEVCRVRGEELQHEGRPAEPGDALLIDGNGENVHLQLVEVVDIRRIRTNLARKGYGTAVRPSSINGKRGNARHRLFSGSGSMSFNPGSALTPSHDDPLEDSVLIRLTETAPARVASTSALEPPLRTGKSSAAC